MKLSATQTSGTSSASAHRKKCSSCLAAPAEEEHVSSSRDALLCTHSHRLSVGAAAERTHINCSYFKGLIISKEEVFSKSDLNSFGEKQI